MHAVGARESWLSDSIGVILVAKKLRLVPQWILRCLRKPSFDVTLWERLEKLPNPR